MVAIITKEQKDKLTSVEFTKDAVFFPIQDVDNNWIISEQEINQCNIEWVKLLVLTEYKPKSIEPLI